MRLTKKREDGQYLKTIKPIDECMNKLGQLEDIEEELGIDSIIYIRMTTGTKVFVKDKSYEQIFENGIMEQRQITYSYSFDHKCFCVNVYGTKTPIYYMKDYGKTWALTKEELL